MNTIDWLSRLIAFDTTSRNSNLSLIEFVRDWLQKQGLTTRLTHDANEPKANLFATLPASNGNEKEAGIIFSGHTDVVPVDGQNWDTDPFVAAQADDKVYGRGASDMKGFIATVLAMIPEFQKHNRSYPLHFAFSYDEEIGCLGAPLIIKDLLAAGYKPKACIVGEPTMMRPVIAHKGIQGFRCRIHGKAAHSSLTPQGCNAIEYASKLIAYIRSYADELREKGPFDKHFDVPFTTITTNLIQGGTANNIVPSFCEFAFEFRYLPDVDPKTIEQKIVNYVQTELLPLMQKENKNARIEIEDTGMVTSFESNIDSEINQTVKSICNEKEILKVAYATEAGLFQDANIPTIICGPGSIEQAHRENEFVSIAQLTQCENFLRKIIKME